MVEFRLYYDDTGSVLYYTCDKPEGNFIVIDSDTYALCRYDIKVIDGKIIKKSNIASTSKLVLDIHGTSCAREDITVIVDNRYDGDVLNWSTKIYEYKHN
jgi:hypothetical protein